MDKRVIKKGMEALVMIDEDVANAVEQVGYPAPRLRPVGFETMFAAILSQQISTDAARFIRERVIALMDDVSAKSLLKVDPEALRGFGLWSAEIYLMFSLRRRDVFPAGDLALRSSLGILKDLEGKLTPKQARELVEHWSPWRSVGSLFLWRYYRGAPN